MQMINESYVLLAAARARSNDAGEDGSVCVRVGVWVAEQMSHKNGKQRLFVDWNSGWRAMRLLTMRVLLREWRGGRDSVLARRCYCCCFKRRLFQPQPRGRQLELAAAFLRCMYVLYIQNVCIISSSSSSSSTARFECGWMDGTTCVRTTGKELAVQSRGTSSPWLCLGTGTPQRDGAAVCSELRRSGTAHKKFSTPNLHSFAPVLGDSDCSLVHGIGHQSAGCPECGVPRSKFSSTSPRFPDFTSQHPTPCPFLCIGACNMHACMHDGMERSRMERWSFSWLAEPTAARAMAGDGISHTVYR